MLALLIAMSLGFQSTRPMRGGTGKDRGGRVDAEFQSTRPVRGGTVNVNWKIVALIISIHPPRAGRDDNGCASDRPAEKISIHPPRAGRD